MTPDTGVATAQLLTEILAELRHIRSALAASGSVSSVELAQTKQMIIRREREFAQAIAEQGEWLSKAHAENERLRTRVLMLLRCHYDEHLHRGSPTCFDVQSPADEWETEALAAKAQS